MFPSLIDKNAPFFHQEAKIGKAVLLQQVQIADYFFITPSRNKQNRNKIIIIIRKKFFEGKERGMLKAEILGCGDYITDYAFIARTIQTFFLIKKLKNFALHYTWVRQLHNK